VLSGPIATARWRARVCRRREFVRPDMSRCKFPADSFDGVAAFYLFLHLPHGELPDLLRKTGMWLRPDGLLVTMMATRADAGRVEPDWLGVPIYFSGFRRRGQSPISHRRRTRDRDLPVREHPRTGPFGSVSVGSRP
jgi:cyclopropane fatty-acyl-phospholipid synthase-like methyltransferase